MMCQEPHTLRGFVHPAKHGNVIGVGKLAKPALSADQIKASVENPVDAVVDAC